MFKEKFEEEKFLGHKYRDYLIKKVEKALTDTGISEEEYE